MKAFKIFELIIGLVAGLGMIFVGTKYITTYLPDIDIVGKWLYLFHLFLGVLVMLKGVDWSCDALELLKTKEVNNESKP